MPAIYKRKTNRGSWSEGSLQNALKEISQGKSVRKCSLEYGIPRRTLRDRLGSGNAKKPYSNRNNVFTPEQEQKLADHAISLSKIFYGMTRREFCSLAYEFALRNNIPNKFSKESKMAGKDWYYSFMKRNPRISLKKPEGTSLNRVIAFNRQSVSIFFKNLLTVQEKNNFPPTKIFNVDETGVSSVQKPQRVLACKGEKVGKVISYERGQTTTAICCVSASGQYIPPYFIFARSRMTPSLLNGAPLGSKGSVSKSGWTNKDIFVDWLHHFIDSTNCSKSKKVLLLLDNHDSHLSLEAYECCTKNGIEVLTLPPHTSHRMQPLDLSIFGPLKSAFNYHCDLFMRNNPGRRITQYEIASIFHDAWKKVATMEKAENGFRASGIFPINPEVFSDEDFLAVDTLKPPGDPCVLDPNSPAPINVDPSSVLDHDPSARITDASSVLDHDPPARINIDPSSALDHDPPARITDPSSVLDHVPNTPINVNPSSVLDHVPNTPINVNPSSVLDHDPPTTSASVSQLSQLPQTSRAIDVDQIWPFPCHSENVNKRKRKVGKSIIFTASTQKNILQNKQPKTTITKKVTGSKSPTQKKVQKKRPVYMKRASCEASANPKTYFCIFCDEPFSDPPSEDWIKCQECAKWSHESCSDFDKNDVMDYTCDFCRFGTKRDF